LTVAIRLLPGGLEPAPLDAYPFLSKVALLGADAILRKSAEPVLYIWQDIAVQGTIMVLAGGPGEGKTTLLFLFLAARLHQGDPKMLLGRPVMPANIGGFVVLIEGEHGEISTCRKLVKSCKIMGVEARIALERIIVIARKAVTIGSPEWRDIEKLITEGRVTDIAIDTIARVAPADANDEREQVAVFEQVAKAIERAPSEALKPTVVALAHTRKGGDRSSLESISGSTQRTGQADTVLGVEGKRNSTGRIVSSKVTFMKLREEPDDYPEPVSFTVLEGGTGIAHFDPADESTEPLSATAKRILELVSASGETPYSALKSGVTNGHYRKLALDELGSRGLVDRIERDGSVFYRLGSRNDP
jgi:AAA domain